MTSSGGEQFEREWLLLCEGVSDERFFTALFETHKIGDRFHLRYPNRDGKYTGGRSNFGADLSAIIVNESFLANGKAILVVSDNDDANSFADVTSQLKKVKGLPIPDAPMKVAKSEGQPHVVVLLLPIGKYGNLESLCLESAYNKWALKDPLDGFVKETPARAWSEGKQAKMRMQTMLAATNSDQPDAGFGASFRQAAQFRIPLDHECFNGVVNFLKTDFPALLV